jgi:hypothetical protein
MPSESAPIYLRARGRFFSCCKKIAKFTKLLEGYFQHFCPKSRMPSRFSKLFEMLETHSITATLIFETNLTNLIMS